MTAKEMANEQEAAREMALCADAAKREAYRVAARRDDKAASHADYLAEIIGRAGWTGAELVELRQQYDYEARTER